MKLDSAVLDDPRVRLLSSVMRGRFVQIALLTDNDGSIPDTYTIAASLGVRLPEVDKTLAECEKVGLIVRDTMTVDYHKRPKTGAERMAKCRASRDVTLASPERHAASHSVTPTSHNVTERHIPPDPPKPQEPKQEQVNNSNSLPPIVPPTDEDGSLAAYPETAKALEQFPAIPSQAQMLELTSLAAKRGDATIAGFVRYVTEKHAADPAKIYAPVGFLLKEIKTLKTPPRVGAAKDPALAVGGGGGALVLTGKWELADLWSEGQRWLGHKGRDPTAFDRAFASKGLTYERWQQLDTERPWEESN